MNLGEIQSAVQALGYTADTSAQQIQFINAEYHNICGKERWPFLETIDSTSITLAPGTAAYDLTLAKPWRNIDAVRVYVPNANNNGIDMRYVEPQELFDHVSRDTEPAAPFQWSMYAGQLWFYPTPDQTYNVSVYYIQEETDLAVSTDTPLIPATYHDVLVWGCVERLGMRERDWLGRQFAQSEKELLLGRLEREYRMRQRQTSSSVKRSGWWSTQVLYPVSSTGF